MKKHKLFLNLTFVLSSLVLVGCSAPETVPEVVKTSRTIEYTKKDLYQGETISLDDLIKVVPGTNETKEEQEDTEFNYEIYSSDGTSDLIEVDSSLSLKNSHTITLLKPGKIILKVTSKDAYKYVSLDIKLAPTLSNFISKINEKDVKSYTVSKNFTIDSSYNVTEVSDGTPTLYKNEKYVYNPSSKTGLLVGNANECYYYQLFDKDNSQTFIPCSNGTSTTPLTSGDFNATYPSLASYFTESSLTFNNSIKKVFGDEYAFGYEYTTANKTQFMSLLTNLGLTYTHSINGKTFYSLFIVPKYEDGQFKFYNISSSTNGSVVEGPYVLNDVNSTTIPVVEEFANNTVMEISEQDPSIYNKFADITSYTCSSKGQFEDMEGNEIDVKDGFEGWLDNKTYNLKWNSSTLYVDFLTDIDSSKTNDEAILKNAVDGTSSIVNLYYKDGSSYVSQGAYGNDPSSGTKITRLENSSTYSNYYPSNMLRPTALKYVSFIKLDTNKYRITAYNDVHSQNLIKYMVGMTTAPVITSTSGPLVYYIKYSYMDLTFDDNGDVHGDLKCKMKDADSEDFIYHYTFTISDIDSTVIDL